MVSELGRFERPRSIRVRAVLSGIVILPFGGFALFGLVDALVRGRGVAQVAGALFLVLLVAELIALVNRVAHRVVVTSEGLVGWRLWGPRVRARWDEVRAVQRWSWVDGEKVRNPPVREAVRLVGPRVGKHVTAVSDMEDFDRFVALVDEHAGQVPRWGPSWVDRVLTWPDRVKDAESER